MQKLSDHYDFYQEELNHKDEFHSIENIPAEPTVKETSFPISWYSNIYFRYLVLIEKSCVNQILKNKMIFNW